MQHCRHRHSQAIHLEWFSTDGPILSPCTLHYTTLPPSLPTPSLRAQRNSELERLTACTCRGKSDPSGLNVLKSCFKRPTQNTCWKNPPAIAGASENYPDKTGWCPQLFSTHTHIHGTHTHTLDTARARACTRHVCWIRGGLLHTLQKSTHSYSVE